MSWPVVGAVPRMELLAWAAVATGIATTAGRVSWSGRAWPGLAVALAWAAWPVVAGDVVARTSRAQAAAWFAAPNHLGAIAGSVLFEAILGGWASLMRVGEIGEGRPARLARRVGPWLPSPTLALGSLGVQITLYHRLSGWGFATIDAALAASLAVAIGGGALGLRRTVRPAGRRAEALVFVFAGLALLGAAIPPLVGRPPTPGRTTAADPRAPIVVGLAATVVMSLGVLRRLARRDREGADLP